MVTVNKQEFLHIFHKRSITFRSNDLFLECNFNLAYRQLNGHKLKRQYNQEYIQMFYMSSVGFLVINIKTQVHKYPKYW